MKLVYELTLTCISLLLLVTSQFIKLPFVYTTLSFYIIFLLSVLTAYIIAPSAKITQMITTQKEKNRVRFFLITLLNLSLILVSLEPYILSKYKLYTPAFYWLNNNIGWAASIILLFSSLLLPAYKMLKTNKKIHKFISSLKNKEIVQEDFEIKVFTLHRKFTDITVEFLRRFHIPIALFGIIFVAYHVYLALISGFKWNYTYISGYAGLLDILLLSVLGLLRFKRLDKNLHKNLTYVLILLLTAHVVFSELRM